MIARHLLFLRFYKSVFSGTPCRMLEGCRYISYFSARNLEFARYRYFLFRCTQFLVVCYAGGWRGSEGTGAVKFTCVLWRRGKTAIELALCFVPTKLNKYLIMHKYQIPDARICICVWFFVFDVDWMFRSGTTTNFGGSRASMAAWRRSMCPGAFC